MRVNSPPNLPSGCPAGCHRPQRALVCWAQVWGEDILLGHPHLQKNFPGLAMSYLWVYTLDTAALLDAIRSEPEASAQILAIRQRWLICRSIVRMAELTVQEANEKGGGTSRGLTGALALLDAERIASRLERRNAFMPQVQHALVSPQQRVHASPLKRTSSTRDSTSPLWHQRAGAPVNAEAPGASETSGFGARGFDVVDSMEDTGGGGVPIGSLGRPSDLDTPAEGGRAGFLLPDGRLSPFHIRGGALEMAPAAGDVSRVASFHAELAGLRHELHTRDVAVHEQLRTMSDAIEQLARAVAASTRTATARQEAQEP